MPRLNKLLPLVRSYLASGGSLIVSSAAQLFTFAIVARSFGVEQFGLFVSITAITTVALQLCGLGASESLIRRVAREPAIYPRMMGHNIVLSSGTGLLLITAGILLLPQIFTLNDDPTLNVAAIASILVTNIALARIIQVAEQAFIAHSMFAVANTNVVIYALARLTTTAFACLAAGVNSLAVWAVWALGAHLLVAGFAIWSLRRLGRPTLGLVGDEIRIGLLFSTPFILRAVRQNTDLLILTALTSAEIVGSYSVARRIFESGYLSVEALNRLIYPGSAALTVKGVHHALERIIKVLAAALAISIFTALAIFILAPLLPYLFGHDYISLVPFARAICWLIVVMAVYAVALEALGASGLQRARAATFNGASILGGVLIALGTWHFGIAGTFGALYISEIGTAVASWLVLLHLISSSRQLATGSAK